MKAMVDVKSRKRINRKDGNYDDEWLWIEFKNVRGKEGWIHGIADFIAFETIDSFILSYRKELCDWCIDHVDVEEKVTSADEAEYKAYSRKGKQDLIARILKDQGYIIDYKIIDDKKQGVIKLALKYTEHNNPVIKSITRISKPGLRKYSGYNNMPRVINGLGIAILTTSQGLMTNKEAKAKNIGGEVLCYVY